MNEPNVSNTPPSPALRLVPRGALGGVQALVERPLMEVIDEQLSPLRRGGGQLAVLVISLDGLQSAGLAHAPAMQDALLAAARERLRRHLRAGDPLVRTSPTSFGVVLLNASYRDAAIVETRLRAKLGEPYGFDSQSVHLSVRSGLAAFPMCGRTGEELLLAAERARDLPRPRRMPESRA